MTRKEIVQVLFVLRIAYPTFHIGIEREEAEEVINLWHELFSEDDFSKVMKAVKSYIVADKKGYPPAIGMIKNKMSQIGDDQTR